MQKMHPELVDAASEQAALNMPRENAAALLGYWTKGATTIEACLAKSVAAVPTDVPAWVAPADAAIWHRAQLEAFRHALEMMGPPEGYGLPKSS